MPRFFLTLLFLFSAALPLPAALPTSVVVDTTIKPAANGQRFLFLVDTSSSMERLQPEVEATVYELIRSGIGGYMRAGDTYGMWTFNKQVYPGRFAMQVWDPRKVSPLGTIAAAFLSEQTYEKPSNVKQAIASLGPVVRSVSNLNVMIISDGSSPMRGTPFDEAINADYKKKNRERKDLKRPFVTTLVVRGGWFVDNSVRIAGQQIPLPERPLPETPVTRTNPPPVAKAPPVGNGKVLEHTVVVDAIPKPKSTLTSSVPNLVATPPSTVQPATGAAKAPDGARASGVASTDNSTSAPPANLAETPGPKVVQITTNPRSIPPNTPDDPPLKSSPATSESILASATGATNGLAAAASLPPPSPAAEPNVPGREATPAAVPSQPDASPVDNALAALMSSTIPVAARELPPGSAPAQAEPPAMQAMTTPTQQGLSAGLMLAFGGALLAAALFLLLMTVRRFRPVPPGSLITQSMDPQTLQRR